MIDSCFSNKPPGVGVPAAVRVRAAQHRGRGDRGPQAERGRRAEDTAPRAAAGLSAHPSGKLFSPVMNFTLVSRNSGHSIVYFTMKYESGGMLA